MSTVSSLHSRHTSGRCLLAACMPVACARLLLLPKVVPARLVETQSWWLQNLWLPAVVLCAASPAVALTGGQASGRLCHCVCNELGQGLCGVTDAQADDLCIRVCLLVGAAPTGDLHREANETGVLAVCWAAGRGCVCPAAAAAAAGTCICILSPILVVTSGNRYPACSLPKFAFLSTLSTAAGAQNTQNAGVIAACTGNPHWAAAMHTPLTLLGGCCTAHCLPDPPSGGCPTSQTQQQIITLELPTRIARTGPALPLLIAFHPPAGNPGTSRGLLVQQSHRRRPGQGSVGGSRIGWVRARRRRLRLQHWEQLVILLPEIAEDGVLTCLVQRARTVSSKVRQVRLPGSSRNHLSF